jgi:hypothetical protein
MAEKPQDRCTECGEEKVVRRWSTHWRTGARIRPIRKMALAFCVTEGCPKSGGQKVA